MSEQFPWHILHPKNLQSPARRLADFSRYSVHRRPPRFVSDTRQMSSFSYVTLVCRRDLLMTRVSLASLLKHAGSIPRLIVAHDESLSSEDITREFSDWPVEYLKYSRDECASFMEREGHGPLGEFCRRHIFGFKLAACLRASQSSRVLYSDADVIWFGDCNRLMHNYAEHPILGSYDMGKAIDSSVVEMLPKTIAEMVQQKPRICAGFAIYNQPLLSHPLVEATVSQIIKQKEIGRLAEQTLVSALARSEGDIIAQEHVQMMKPNIAQMTLAFKNRPSFARHYPFNVRPQFWIDWKLT